MDKNEVITPLDAYNMYKSISDDLLDICRSLNETAPAANKKLGEMQLEEVELNGDLYIMSEIMLHKAECIIRRFQDFDPEKDGDRWRKWMWQVCVQQLLELKYQLSRMPSYAYKRENPDSWLIRRIAEVEDNTMKTAVKFVRVK